VGGGGRGQVDGAYTLILAQAVRDLAQAVRDLATGRQIINFKTVMRVRVELVFAILPQMDWAPKQSFKQMSGNVVICNPRTGFNSIVLGRPDFSIPY
jgi:hypothetical protein